MPIPARRESIYRRRCLSETVMADLLQEVGITDLQDPGHLGFVPAPETLSSPVLIHKKTETNIDAQMSCTHMKCGAQMTSEESTL